MTRQIVLRPLAVADLDDIWDYTVATWSQRQAETYLGGLGAVFDLLAEHPEIARVRHEFTPNVRLHRYKSHLVVFTADDRTLDVIRVLHGRANWVAFLAE